MKISGIGPKIILTNDSNAKNVNKAEELNKKDRLYISGEAKALKGGSTKDLELIKQKMNDGFYNSDKVINKVADEILKEINGE